MYTTTVDTTAPPTPVARGRQRIGVPAYFDPGPGWDDMVKAVPDVGLVILNLDSGPGESIDLRIGRQVVAARDAGLMVLGYVDTDSARRPTPAVQADTGHYFEWYGVDGIFFDQAHVSAKRVSSYYRPLYEFVKSQSDHATVVLNPGTSVPEYFLAAADIVVDFEGFYVDYLGWTPPAWTSRYDPTRFWHIIHDVATHAQLQAVQRLSQHRSAGYLYITDQTQEPRPPDMHLYDRLPHTPYWSELQRGLAGSDGTEVAQ
jgi:hypothetical protein